MVCCIDFPHVVMGENSVTAPYGYKARTLEALIYNDLRCLNFVTGAVRGKGSI